jgi:hypothetical protein
MNLRWAKCIENVQMGKMEIIPPEKRVLADDPRYAPEIHIVPCRPEDVTNIFEFQLGAHDFSQQCYCRPKIQHCADGRMIVIHSEGTIQ